MIAVEAQPYASIEATFTAPLEASLRVSGQAYVCKAI